MEAPSDLVTFDETHHSFRVSWTEPDSPPEKFLLTYSRTAGGDVQEVKRPLEVSKLDGPQRVSALRDGRPHVPAGFFSCRQ